MGQRRRATKPWTSLELRELRANRQLGADAVAKLLGRSMSSVKACAHRNRITLRRRGELRGSVLGQPRGVSLRADLREDLVSGVVDAEAVARRVRLDEDAALCPSCGRRPVTVRHTGMCRVCHLKRLTEAHLDAIEELSAQRALWASRQCLKRTRDRVGRRGAEV